MFEQNELKPVWSQVEVLLSDGISVIPVRDRDETLADGGIAIKKSPYRKWKQFQSRIATKQELFYLIEQYNTSAVATICGRVSGNLEVIDIDVKWLPGIDARYFNDIRTLYPDIYNKLRIHKSPSGGYHLIYRVENSFVIPGNGKLGRRMATEAELLANPKEKIKCFLETRGEGGYVLAPPSLGYSVHQDNPIPVLTSSERESLIALARCYDQLVKVEPSSSPIPHQDNYYDTNPFEHYNQSPEGSEILINNGWKQLHRSGDYIHFNRPGSTTNAIHASFIISRRIFYIFTTNSAFENERGYKPSTALAILQFNGDRKQAYHYLVSKGYGVIKPSVEQRLIKSKAVQHKPLPANASPDAIKKHQEAITLLDTLHPHGLFWELEEERIVINREGLYQVANALGFRWDEAYQGVVHIRGYFIHRVSEREFFDTLKSYIKEEDAELYEDICNAYESFIQRAGKFTCTRIQLLDTSNIIRDTPQTCYKFYQNGYVFITAETYSLNPYENLAGLIWYDRVQHRQFSPGECEGKYIEFLRLSCQYDLQSEYIQSIIGFLTHEYKDETTGYIPVFTEQCEDPRHGGGSGKNVFASLFRNATSFKSIPGEQVRYDAAFMQSWDRERIFCISDSPKNFNFLFLKDLSTGDGMFKKLFKDEQIVPVSDMPKFIVLTNYSYEVKDGGLRRRIIPLEFTDFFTRCGGVDVHFGCHFPNGWSLSDWMGFDNLVATSISLYLRRKMKLTNQSLSESGWLKQFEQSYMPITRQFIEENFDNWCSLPDGFVSNTDFNAQYNTFLLENNVGKAFSLSSTKMNKALNDWCEKHKFTMEHNVTRTHNSVTCKGRYFIPQAPF